MSQSRAHSHRDEHALNAFYSLTFLRGNLGTPQLWAANLILGTEYRRSLQDAPNRAPNDNLIAQINGGMLTSVPLLLQA
jgi:hypothetical protein